MNNISANSANKNTLGKDFNSKSSIPVSRAKGTSAKGRGAAAADVGKTALDKDVKSARGELAQLASSPEGNEQLSHALDAQLLQERTLDEQIVLDKMFNRLGTDPGFKPKVIMVSTADINSKNAPETALPKGVNAAFIPSKGIILVREGLSPKEQKAAIREEIGEWFASSAEKAGVKLAKGDAGARVRSLIIGKEASAADFKANASDTTTVRFEGKTYQARAQQGNAFFASDLPTDAQRANAEKTVKKAKADLQAANFALNNSKLNPRQRGQVQAKAQRLKQQIGLEESKLKTWDKAEESFTKRLKNDLGPRYISARDYKARVANLEQKKNDLGVASFGAKNSISLKISNLTNDRQWSAAREPVAPNKAAGPAASANNINSRFAPAKTVGAEVTQRNGKKTIQKIDVKRNGQNITKISLWRSKDTEGGRNPFGRNSNETFIKDVANPVTNVVNAVKDGIGNTLADAFGFPHNYSPPAGSGGNSFTASYNGMRTATTNIVSATADPLNAAMLDKLNKRGFQGFNVIEKDFDPSGQKRGKERTRGYTNKVGVPFIDISMRRGQGGTKEAVEGAIFDAYAATVEGRARLPEWKKSKALDTAPLTTANWPASAAPFAARQDLKDSLKAWITIARRGATPADSKTINSFKGSFAYFNRTLAPELGVAPVKAVGAQGIQNINGGKPFNAEQFPDVMAKAGYGFRQGQVSSAVNLSARLAETVGGTFTPENI
ncbi:hypothetical protein F9L33_15665, partial [Amylibacter sp. SFDW26]|uniref:hypothetical protein n=1 Tax=Amylibacter sp. SFDW26 TaxID=2652722 RepID=UPI0012616F20